MTYFEAYLLTRLDSLNTFFAIAGIIVLASIILFTMVQSMIISDEYNDKEKKLKKLFLIKFLKISIPCVTIICLISSLIPTTKEAAFIYIAPVIVNNQDVQKTIKKLPELSGLGLEYLSDILKKKIEDKVKE